MAKQPLPTPGLIDSSQVVFFVAATCAISWWLLRSDLQITAHFGVLFCILALGVFYMASMTFLIRQAWALGDTVLLLILGVIVVNALGWYMESLHISLGHSLPVLYRNPGGVRIVHAGITQFTLGALFQFYVLLVFAVAGISAAVLELLYRLVRAEKLVKLIGLLKIDARLDTLGSAWNDHNFLMSNVRGVIWFIGISLVFICVEVVLASRLH